MAAGLLLVAAYSVHAIAETEDLERLRERANRLYQIGKSIEALPLAQRVLAISEERFGSESADVGVALNTLGIIYYNLGRYADAESTLRRAIAIAEATLGASDWTIGARLNNLGMALAAQGHYGESEKAYKRAVLIAESAFGPNGVEVARALTNSAIALYKQGRLAEAEAFCKRALSIRESALGPEHPDVAHTLNSLALVYSDQGRYADAEPVARRALAIDEAAYGPNHPNMVSRLNNLADIYRLEGRYGDAEALYKRAVAVAEQSGNDHFVRAILNNLAWLYWVQQRYGEAEPHYLRSLGIAERLLGADHPDLLTHLQNLAALRRVQGRTADAEALLNRALAIGEKAGGNHPHFAKALNNLALVYQEQGRYAEAEALFERAFATAEKVLGPDHPDCGTYLGNMGALQAVQGNWTAAAKHLQQSARIAIARHRRMAGATGTVTSGAAAAELDRPGAKLALLVKVLARLSSPTGGQNAIAPEMYEAAQWAHGSQAAMSIGQMAARQAKQDTALAAIVRERQDLWSEWQARDKLLVAAVSRPPERRDGAAETKLRDRLAAIDRRIADIDTTLAKRFPEYAALANPEPLSIEASQAQLGADEALVLVIDAPDLGRAPEEAFVLVVTKHDTRWVRSELGTKALTARVAALRCGLDATLWNDGESANRCKGMLAAMPHRETVTVSGKDQSVPALPFDVARAHELYQTLLGPVEDIVKNKRLLLIPSGPLTGLPFSVLVMQPPKEAIPEALAQYRDVAWLGTHTTITVLPSIASLKSLRQFARTSRARRPYLGIGNPLLDGPQDDPVWGAYYRERAELARKRRCSRQINLPRIALARGPSLVRSFPAVFRGPHVDIEQIREQVALPETADELCEVARRLGVPSSEILLGADATEARLKYLSEHDRLADYAILHFATHGTLTGEVKGSAEPGLILTPPPKGTRDPQALERDDGFLTASEIATLKLDADWVILSACNTAGAQGEGAEALSGMARAFFYAGARALLVSHWEVDSDAAVKLTTRTFAELKAHPEIGRAEAFRLSMRELIEKGDAHEAHPSHWAPFVIVGEGAAPP
jgi:tetratricopeptide (TPR) repeat protein